MLPNKKYSAFELLRIAQRHWLLLVVPPAVTLFGALLFSSTLPNIYQASTLIQIVPQRVPDSYVQSTITIRTEDRIDALGQQVMSRTQLERLILDLNLYEGMRAHQPMQDVVEHMRAAVDIEMVRSGSGRDRDVEAFYLRFRYGDPVMAARVTERLGMLYVQYNAKERGALADTANSFLEAQLQEAEARLAAQEKKLQEFRERYAGRLPTQLQYNLQAIQSTQMQRQALVESLARDRDRKLMLERLYNDLMMAPVPALPATQQQAVDPTHIATLPAHQQLPIARSNLERLEARLKEGHPDLTRARKLVADLEKQVAESAESKNPTVTATADELQRRQRASEMRAEIESLNRQIAFKESEERRLSGVIADYQSRIEAVPGVESEWLALTRDYDTLQESFRDLLAKSEAARQAAALEDRQIGEQFRTLDAPRVPIRPVSPNRLLISSSGAGIGLALGLLLIALLEVRDNTLRTEQDVLQVLDMPVLAQVPKVITPDDHRRMRMRRMAGAAVAATVVASCGYVVWAMGLWRLII